MARDDRLLSMARRSSYRCIRTGRRRFARIRRERPRRWCKIGERRWKASRRSSPRMDRSVGRPWRRTTCNPIQRSRQRPVQRLELPCRKCEEYSLCRYWRRTSRIGNFPVDQSPRERQLSMVENHCFVRLTVVWKYFRIPTLVISLNSDRPFHIAPPRTNSRPSVQIPWWISPGGWTSVTTISSPSPWV